MAENIQGVEREFRMLADHPALDLLNTVARVDGELVDSFENDADVLQWLAKVSLPANGPELRPSVLLHAIKALRELIRPIVVKRAAGKRADVTALNEFLAKAQSHIVLVPEKNSGLRVEREWQQRSAEQVLAPLAESAAEFVATADFELVRLCENEECVLWFYDRTRSHHRRWCSMATCGNRHKVAAFRERQARG